mgnify:CR=1 FL=1
MNLTAYALGVFNATFAQSEKGVILATSYVFTGMNMGSALTN